MGTRGKGTRPPTPHSPDPGPGPPPCPRAPAVPSGLRAEVGLSASRTYGTAHSDLGANRAGRLGRLESRAGARRGECSGTSGPAGGGARGRGPRRKKKPLWHRVRRCVRLLRAMAPAAALTRLLSAGERAGKPLVPDLQGRCLGTWEREGGREDARATNPRSALTAGVCPRPLRLHVLKAMAPEPGQPSIRTLGSTAAPAVSEPEGSSSNTGLGAAQGRGLQGPRQASPVWVEIVCRQESLVPLCLDVKPRRGPNPGRRGRGGGALGSPHPQLSWCLAAAQSSAPL